MTTQRATIFLQIRADRNASGNVYRVAPVGVTQRPPRKLAADTIAVRVAVEVDSAAFEPLDAGTAVVEVVDIPVNADVEQVNG